MFLRSRLRSVPSMVHTDTTDMEQYNASKAAVVQLARCLSVEWVDFCRVNCISPGFIETEILDAHPQEWRAKWHSMIPAQRMAQAYELKGVCISRD
jgi:sorbose reductase